MKVLETLGIAEKMRRKLSLEDGKKNKQKKPPTPLFCGGRKFGNTVISIMWEIENATNGLLYLAKEIPSKISPF